MRIHDVSLTISEGMIVYGSDPPVEIDPISRIARGDCANVSLLRLCSHTGTHVDAPFHFVEGGSKVDELPLDVLVGDCIVCDVSSPEAITVADLEACRLPDACVRVLIRTSNSRLWEKTDFHENFVYLDTDAASWLVERGIRLVGVDYLSVDRFRSATHPTHLRLLGSGVIAVEGLDLRKISPGEFFLVCLPLKVKGLDGAPARAILIES